MPIASRTRNPKPGSIVKSHSPSQLKPTTFCRVDLSALRWNLAYLRNTLAAEVQILAVVKANAYGHGDIEITRTLSQNGVRYFGVATVQEGIRLRQAGISDSVIVLGGLYPEEFEALLEHSLTPVVTEPRILRTLDALASARNHCIDCHLKIDTGMGRLGWLADNVHEWLPDLEDLDAVNIHGIMSHFAIAEGVESSSRYRQLAGFRKVLAALREAGHEPVLAHMANSAALLTFPESHFDMVRPGGSLYGIFSHPPLSRNNPLKPVLSWRSRVLQVKRIHRNHPVSYGETFVTTRDSAIATLSVGYADGLKRSLSNKGSVLIRGQRAPIVGLVTMDLTMVDVTDIAGVQQGDEVVLLGTQGQETISAEEVAGWANTISYEILTSISSTIPRYYINEEEA
jgi:alanine racemase